MCQQALGKLSSSVKVKAMSNVFSICTQLTFTGELMIKDSQGCDLRPIVMLPQLCARMASFPTTNARA